MMGPASSRGVIPRPIGMMGFNGIPVESTLDIVCADNAIWYPVITLTSKALEGFRFFVDAVNGDYLELQHKVAQICDIGADFETTGGTLIVKVGLFVNDSALPVFGIDRKMGANGDLGSTSDPDILCPVADGIVKGDKLRLKVNCSLNLITVKFHKVKLRLH